MGVDQVGYQVFVVEIDDLVVVIGQGVQFGFVVDCEDLFVFYCQGFGEGLLWIGGEDFGVDYQQVGGVEGVQGDGQVGVGEEGGNLLFYGGFFCFLVLCSVVWVR